ncbi:MAG TPA: hypothetical protein VEY88_26355 [Archangium sp.]|nr:hypothetical protein [Archangium sp.]
MKDQQTSSPASVRALEVILDDGRIFAQPGDVGLVLHAERYEDGSIALTVQFPDVSGATTCFLGVDVEARLTLVTPAQEAPTVTPPAAAAPRRTLSRRTASLTAAGLVLVGLALALPGKSPEVQDAGVVVEAPRHAEGTVMVASIDERIPARPEDVPPEWMRAPCPKRPRVRTIQTACFIAVGPPPCDVGIEHAGECVVPIAKGQQFPSSINR